MVATGILRSLLRDRANLFQSFVQPLVLAWILSVSLGAAFSVDMPSNDTPRAFFLSFSASEFYAVVVLLLTVMVASQYATDMAERCVGPDAALVRPLQYGSAAGSALSIAAGIIMLVIASTIFFLVGSALLLGVAWPWSSAAFWVLLGGLILLSVSSGFALGLATGNRGLSDLLISVIVFGSALGAGAFFPYPETSRVWSLAAYNPFAHLLARLLGLLRGTAGSPGPLAYVVWMSVPVIIATGIRHLRRRTRSCDSDVPRVATGWVRRERGAIVCGLGIPVLPVAIWLTGPARFVPSASAGSAGLMYPYAGLATAVILLLHMLLVAPLVDGSVVLRNLRSFRRRFLLQRAGLGAALVLLSVVTAAVVWRSPIGILFHAAVALGLFQVWSLGLMLLFSEVSKDRSVYWALALTATLLITFLGGSFWRPSLLGSFGHGLSYALPNGLLLHHHPLPAVLVVPAQSMLLFAAGSPRVRQWFRRLGRLRGAHPAADPRVPRHVPRPSPPVAHSSPERVHGGLVESLMLRERKRILDEVHDTLGHGITGALWQIRSAKGMTDDPALQETLDRASEGLEQGLSRIRGYLRDSAPRRSSDWRELYSLVAQFSRCPVDLSVSGDPGDFHPAAVNRFTQALRELLTNALRYGEPSSIHVQLVRTSRLHRLEYRERGRGWGGRGPRMGYGLSTVQALFIEVGGSFSLDHLPGARGIQVVAVIPNRKERTHEQE